MPFAVGCTARHDAPPTAAKHAAEGAAAHGRGEALAPGRRAALGRDAALTSALLAMPFRSLARALGPHEVRCRSSVRVTGTLAPRAVRQEAQLRVDSQGNQTGLKHTHAQHGEEFTWIAGWLYSRSRYSRFIKRRAAREEVEARADRTYGLLPAYLDLLGRALRVSRVGTTRFAERPAVKVALALRPGGGSPPTAEGPARRWRQHVVVKELAGTALLDEATGAPLSVDLRARWTFAPPARDEPRTGIPDALDTGRNAEMSLDFEQRVTRVGVGVRPIAAPTDEDVLVDARRLRLERERQFVAGERALPKQWPHVEPYTDPGARR